jgi:hypothetical protein
LTGAVTDVVVERFPEANTAQVSHDVDEALAAHGAGLSGINLDANVFRPASYMTTALRHLGVAGSSEHWLVVAVVCSYFLASRFDPCGCGPALPGISGLGATPSW